ncbi:alpha/beta hydrolase [Halobacteriovorax sp. RT-2-6]|uniref:alpha/beta hydrolase n=1 Tax=unclassified Halobacteriovorax TaxID=2639665 RepID=UPI00399AB80B
MEVLNLKNVSKFMVIGSLAFLAACSNQKIKKGDKMNLIKEWDKTFKKSELVEHKKVIFKNRYNIELVGDLYIPKNTKIQKLPALAVSGPFGAVKEQSSGLYAQEMAEKGFVTLAFDPSYTGESGGEPRNLASAEINTEDFSAAVDFLGTREFVDREKIGVIGICGFGGFGLSAAAVDKRIKAVVTTSMYDMSAAMANGVGNTLTKETRTQALEALSNQRYADFEKDAPSVGPRNLPETLSEDDNIVIKRFFDYYRTDRGFHERSINSTTGWSATSPLSFMNFPLLTYVNEISPRPILIIAGEEAHSLYFSKDAYAAAAEPKELMVMPGVNHVDLYDKKDIIPFEKITKFFQDNLK